MFLKYLFQEKRNSRDMTCLTSFKTKILNLLGIHSLIFLRVCSFKDYLWSPALVFYSMFMWCKLLQFEVNVVFPHRFFVLQNEEQEPVAGVTSLNINIQYSMGHYRKFY